MCGMFSVALLQLQQKFFSVAAAFVVISVVIT
jgi:hypothetical protein